jgi:hypothetical protein
MAAWLHGGRPQHIALSDGRIVDVLDILRQGMVAGANPESPEYWGSIDSRDSRIVEAADIALAIWLTRPILWDELSEIQRQQLAAWLYGVNGKQTVDNNWHLFVVLVNVILDDLGMPANLNEARRRYDRFKSFHIGGGWFKDGPNGHVDYYNAWGMHYSLYWIRRVAPGWDEKFLLNALAEFSGALKYFVGPTGIPIMGRSVCYRGAVAAPLVMASSDGAAVVSAGEARRALDIIWSFLVRNGGVVRGSVSQGYCSDDPRFLDSYSGPASCLWSLRSLVAAFVIPDNQLFWSESGEPLPVERGDFEFTITSIGWRIVGDHQTGDITLWIDANRGATKPKIEPYALFWRITDGLICRSRRPENSRAKYGAEFYSSSKPFTGCPN